MAKQKKNHHTMIYFIVISVIVIIGLPIALYFLLKLKKDNVDEFLSKPKSNIKSDHHFKKSQPSEFITWDPSARQFKLKGKTFYATGCNMPWMGFATTNMFVTDPKTPKKCFTQPEQIKITETLKYARDTLNCNVIRCHTLGFSAFSEDSFIPQYGGKINENYWKIVDFIIVTAKKLGLYLIPVLTDQYSYYNGNYNVFSESEETIGDFYTVGSTAYKNYTSFVNQYLNHEIEGLGTKIMNEPTIFCIEFGNELGDHSEDPTATYCLQKSNWPCSCVGTGSVDIPFTNCQPPPKEWLSTIAQYIKSIDKNHLLMTGTNWCQMDYPYLSGKCDWDIDNIDIVSFHWYYSLNADQTDFDSPDKWDQITNACKMVSDKNKAVIFGEYPGYYYTITKYFQFLDGLINDKFLQGELFWDLRFDNDCASDTPYGLQPTTDAASLVLYANHFKPYKFSDGSRDDCMLRTACNEICPGSPKTTINILLIGDSITSGYHCSTKRTGDDGQQVCHTCGNCGSLTGCDFSTGCKTITDSSPGAVDCNFQNNCSSSFADFLADYLKTYNININVHINAVQGTTSIKNEKCPIPLYGGQYADTTCWQRDLPSSDIDFITIMFGTNDSLTANLSNCFNITDDTPDPDYGPFMTNYLAGLTTIINTLKSQYPSAIIILMRPLPSNVVNQQIITTEYAQLTDFAKSLQIQYLDLYTEITTKYQDWDSLLCDHVHPYNNLNKMIGEFIGKFIGDNYLTKQNVKNPTITFYRCNSSCPDDH